MSDTIKKIITDSDQTISEIKLVIMVNLHQKIIILFP